MRFSLIDRIVTLDSGKTITAVKNLSLAEEYLADHFPGFPVMPGVLMLESMVQAGAWLMRYTEDFKYSTVLLKQARALRFNNFVVPGKMLTISAGIQKWEGSDCVLKASGTVDETTAVSAKLTLTQFNLSERNDEMADADRFSIEKMRSLFDQLWTTPMQTETNQE